jgi:uncharacterized membrane protein
MSSWLTQYALAVLAFCVLDGIWLTVVAADLYDDRLGTLLAEEPNALAAVAFYALFVAGLVHFVIRPAVAAGSWRSAVLNGGFFGLVTYATWDLTNLAVLEGFPASLVPVDLAWGTVLAASTSVATYAAFRRLRPRAA